MTYNFFSYTGSLEFALTRLGYYAYKSYHSWATSGLENPIFHEVRSVFIIAVLVPIGENSLG